ncbi:MAG: FecR domain-containing protein [Ferruginibacter sp.]|nr:FecR domain-containing protein [Cytophagales bacterium]
MAEQYDLQRLLQKYIRNECSPAELQFLAEQFRKAEPDGQLLHWMEEDWNTYAPENTPESSLKGARSDRMLRRILGDKAAGTTVKTVPVRPFRWLRRVAAAGLMLLVAGWITYRFYRSSGVAYATSTAAGKLVHLPDGSRVHLNGFSRITYHESFLGDRREVVFSGEAFFKVARNSRPFRITTRRALVKVLGTQFNLKEYERGVWIAVAEGKVSLASLASPGDQTAVLTRNQFGQVLADGQMLVETGDITNYTSWMPNQQLVFRDVPLPEVMLQLERLYGLPFEWPATLNDLRLTATICRVSLNDILTKISLSLGIRYQIQTNKVILAPESQ